MDAICAIAQRHNLRVIEDAAQAHGAAYKGKRAGQWGDAAAFSFYPGKNLGAYGDAGAICTNDAALAALVAKLRNHGRTKKYEHDVIGYGERCDTLQAAVLHAKLKHLDHWNHARRRCAQRYHDALSGIPGITTPATQADSEPVFHIYCIRVTGDRDAMVDELKKRGVEAGVHYPIPVHLQPALRHRGCQPGAFPHAEAAASTIMSLPIYPEITDSQIDTVISHVIDVVGTLRA